MKTQFLDTLEPRKERKAAQEAEKAVATAKKEEEKKKKQENLITMVGARLGKAASWFFQACRPILTRQKKPQEAWSADRLHGTILQHRQERIQKKRAAKEAKAAKKAARAAAAQSAAVAGGKALTAEILLGRQAKRFEPLEPWRRDSSRRDSSRRSHGLSTREFAAG